MSDPEAVSKHFLQSEESQWLDTFKTNVMGQYFMSMAFLPLLAAGGSVTPGYTSSVVNVSSISGAMKGPSAGQPAYASSKASFTHLSRMLATVFKECKVRVNVIAPGVFPSEMTAGDSGEDNKSKLDMQPSNPAGRTGQDTDMAATILFLAGSGGVFYNEQILYPDGGEYSMHDREVVMVRMADWLCRIYATAACAEVSVNNTCTICTNTAFATKHVLVNAHQHLHTSSYDLSTVDYTTASCVVPIPSMSNLSRLRRAFRTTARTSKFSVRRPEFDVRCTFL